ncbi:MAG: HD domain-containing protein [Bacteroidota bacterium]
MPDFRDHLHSNPIFECVASVAAKMNLPVWLVGGYVRDLLLNRPCKDIDFVCLGSAPELAEAVGREIDAKTGRHTQVTVFKTFGTAMLRHGDTELEFVGARKESYSPESRKPAVEPGTLEDDQNRRDFTVNALAISLNREDYGSLLDPFNGLEHLKQKLLCTPVDPDVTFSDDPLRMLRAVRFASQLNFDIDADTFAGIKRNAARLEIVSPERINVELNKIILSLKPSYGFKLLLHADLLNLILPEMVLLLGAQNVEGHTHKDNFYHTLEVLDGVAKRSNDLWLRWAAILHDIAKPETKRLDPKHGWTFHGHEERGAKMVPKIFRRLRLPLGEQSRFVQKLVRMHLRPISLVKEGVTDSAVRRLMVEAGNDLEALMLLVRADVTTKNPEKARRHLAGFDKVERHMAEVEATDKLRSFRPIISGEIVMAVFGLSPGREVGAVKEVVRQAILDGDVPNSLAGALPYLLKTGENHGYKPVMPESEILPFLESLINPASEEVADTGEINPGA